MRVTLLAVYLLPKRTNSRKLLFISISCIYIIVCVHIVKYLYKLMLCWIFHIIPTRYSQDMDHWNIYLHFWVTCVWGIPLTSVHAQKLKIEIYKTSAFTFFRSLKHFRRLSFIFTSILSQCYEKNSGNDKFYWMTL